MSDGNDGMDASEAFGLVADETRFGILQSLWDLTEGTDRWTVSFADLRAETGMRDSGRFNYHLDQLTPQFVRKAAEGYALTMAGRQVVGAAVSGVYTDHETSMEPRAVGECHECGGTIEAQYEHGRMLVTCRDCGLHLSDMSAPPVLVATHDADELPAVLSKHLLTEVQRMNRGFCVHCGGPLETSVVPREREGFDDWNVRFTCEACGGQASSVVTGAVVDHPAVVAFLHDAGIDYRETPIWEVEPFLTASETVVSEDPLRVETTLESDAGILTLTVDGDLNVVDYERRDAGE